MPNPQKPFTETGTSPPVRAELARIDPVPGCTVGTGVGLDAHGIEVTFSSDWRSCLALAEILQAGGGAEVYLDNGRLTCWNSRGRS